MEGGKKLRSYFKDIFGPKFMNFFDNVGNPLSLPMPLSDCLRHISLQRYKPLHLPLSSEVVKNVNVEFHSARSEGSWQIKKVEDRRSSIVVKPKSADDYMGLMN